MDAWNLLMDKGGAVVVHANESAAETKESWPGIANDIERILYVSGVGVTQIVGNVFRIHKVWNQSCNTVLGKEGTKTC